SLMQAIQTGGEPLTSAEDNLGTLRVIEAAYLSMKEARAVRPEEFNVDRAAVQLPSLRSATAA
ncbi:MAG TPA: hypothetical protein VI547_16130, partial [Anaerolineales bacterium]|nr:hypothetical protein [Anaerolineales bacterium]